MANIWVADAATVGTQDSSNLSFTVPAEREWMPLTLYITLATTATAGNRQVTVEILNAANVVQLRLEAGAVQAASLTRYYAFGVGLQDLAGFRNSAYLCTPLPALYLAPGYRIKVHDSNAVDANADDMVVRLLYEYRIL